MSREQYTVPALSQQPTTTTGGSATATSFNAPLGGEGSTAEGTGPPITYICGHCAAKVPLKRGEQIRCKECGHRVLYKERTKRMVQFEAR